MIGGQIRPLATRALACAVRRCGLSGAPAPAVGTEEEQTRRPRSKGMVAAAFAQLGPDLDERITAAGTSVESLLAVAGGPGIRREHALKIVAALAERAAADGPEATAKFENDSRFTHLCQLLGQQAAKQAAIRHDLATVISVAADDEAARMAHSLSLEQSVKVMSALGSKKRRSVPLLRALASNLCQKQETLSVKQSSDLLYALALLNFPDEGLLDKIQQSLLENLASNEKAAPVGSALTSLGILRYRDSTLLDAMSEWIVTHSSKCRPQDLVSFLLTLAYTGYEPANLDVAVTTVMGRLSGPQDAPTASAWLDTVWALTVLGRLQASQAASVFQAEFIEQLKSNEKLGPTATIKLLNIDAAVKLEIKDYNGPSLSLESPLTPMRPKNKEPLIKSVVDALQNLFPNTGYLKTNSDSGMGFLIDAECLIDAKGNPLPLDKPSPPRTKSSRIGVLVWDYSDLCRRVREPTGPNKLAIRLLQAQGLRVLQVPHYEFNPTEKLVQRVQYLERKIKAIAKDKKK